MNCTINYDNSHRYDKFNALTQLQELVMFKQGNFTNYCKMIRTGNLGLHDYCRGFIHVEIFITKSVKDGEIKHFARIYFATVDDGDFGGVSIAMSPEKAQKTVHEIAEVFRDMDELPTKNELNTLLNPLGVAVDYE